MEVVGLLQQGMQVKKKKVNQSIPVQPDSVCNNMFTMIPSKGLNDIAELTNHHIKWSRNHLIYRPYTNTGRQH